MTESTIEPAQNNTDKPDLNRRLFWDVRYDEIEWNEESRFIISRVIERGNDEEWKEVIRFYGMDKVLHTLKHEATYFMTHTIERICKYFNLKHEDLRCFYRAPWRQFGRWL